MRLLLALTGGLSTAGRPPAEQSRTEDAASGALAYAIPTRGILDAVYRGAAKAPETLLGGSEYRGADKALITGVGVFDQFAGKTLGEGKKSIAISVTLQPLDHTLSDAEIEAVAAKIVAAVNKATGGTLRT